MQALDSSFKLMIGVSSRALFDLEESNQIFEKEGLLAYTHYQIAHEEKKLSPGVAFPLVQKLLNLRDPLTQEPLVEVFLLSRNSADSGLRIFNSIQQYQLHISRAVFTNGESPYRYIQAFHSHLFLSANPDDVRKALLSNCAAATILPSSPTKNETPDLRIAFDGDSVIFSDESEKIYQEKGLEAFAQNEAAIAKLPLSGGPFKGFLSALQKIQQLFPTDACPIRTALMTARSAPTHERVIRTLRDWNIFLNEAFFLGGLDKTEFLTAFGADFFFDDQISHCEKSRNHVATGHVPHGIINVEKNK